MPINVTTAGSITYQQKAVLRDYANLLLLSQFRFNESQQREDIRVWAPKANDAAFRTFQFRRTGESSDPLILDPSARWNIEDYTLTIAYPVLPSFYKLYETAVPSDPLTVEMNAMETVIRYDARVVRDLLFASTNYILGQQACFVTILPTDRDNDACWFQDFKLTLHYMEEQGT